MSHPSAPTPDSLGQPAASTQPAASAQPATSGMAITSLVLGILGILGCLTGLIGAILGHVAMSKIKKSNGQLTGSGLALGGIITGWLSLLMIPIMAAILVPAVTQVIGDAKITEMKFIGKNIYISVYADAIDYDVVGFPEVGEYSSSTAFFKALAGENEKQERLLAATPDFVSGPGFSIATSWSQLQAGDVAWCITTGFSESSDAGIPFAFSANVAATSLHQLTGSVGATMDPNSNMRGKNVVVAMHGGGARVLRNTDRWEDLFIATDYPDHPILRP